MYWGNLILSGLTQGAIYALLAMGFNIIFATTHVLNFAHGEMLMIGGMIGVVVVVSLGLPPVLAVVVVIAMGALFGALEERVAVRPALKLSRTAVGGGFSTALGWLLATLAFAIILRSAFALMMGPDVRGMPSIIPGDTVVVGGLRFAPDRFAILILAVVMAVLLTQFYKRTMIGQALVAIAQDPEAAKLRGIPVERFSTLAFALGSALAALTGFLAAPLTGAFATIGFLFALKGFVAAAIGGIPSIGGALVGGLALGVVESVGIGVIGAGYREPLVFAVLLLFLLLKPSGLASREVRAV